MIDQQKSQPKCSKSWEQIKIRLNDNLLKKNAGNVDCSILPDSMQKKYMQKEIEEPMGTHYAF